MDDIIRACLVLGGCRAVSGDTGTLDTHNQDWFLVASFTLLQCCRATQSAVRSVPACSGMEAAVRKISWNLVRLM